MADLCMCGHEEGEHSDEVVDGARDCDSGPWDDLIHPCMVGAADGDDRPECRCRFYTRDPQRSAFRGPAVSFTREEAAGWVAVLLDLWASRHVAGTPEQMRAAVRMYVRQARWCLDAGLPRDAARLYLAARILRAVRP